MDLPTLIEACFNGLAKGGASALGSGLWVLTQRLICGLTSKFVTADDVSEADVLIELSDPNQMIQKMDEFRRDPEQLPRLRLPNQAMLQHECDNAAMCFDVVQVQVEAGDASAVLDNGLE